MKKYKTTSSNKGTTIILDSVYEAIELARKYANSNEKIGGYLYDKLKEVEECISCISKGDLELKKEIDKYIDDLLGVVDDIQPKFPQMQQGYEKCEDGITSTPDLILSGEEMSCLKRKHSPLELKEGASGEGAYRVLINTDVSWWGNATDNASLVGALIFLLSCIENKKAVSFYTLRLILNRSEMVISLIQQCFLSIRHCRIFCNGFWFSF